jgi:multiple sugar transport system permease protein
LLAALLGTLSSLLGVTLWTVVATIFGDLETVLPLGWALLSGAVIGTVIGAFRQAKNTPATVTLVTGLVTGILWLILSGGRPLGMPELHLIWGVIGALLTFSAAAHLTRYGLRDLGLGRVDRNHLELLLLRVTRAFGFVFFLTVVIFPFYFMVASSLKPRAELLQNPSYLGVDLTRKLSDLLVGYREVLVTHEFWRFILNSTFVSLVTVAITLVLSVLGAYAVTRLAFPGRNLLSRSILLIYMFPAIVLVIPLYSVFSQLGLRDTLPGLLIVYPATTLPVALYMLRSYFQTLPKDLEEAGMIDGCTRLSVIWRITLPLSLPALASVGLYVFMIAWNEFLFAFMFLDTPAIFTLSRGMVGLNSQEVPRQFLMAGAVIVTVPIMVIFFWFEKYLVGGLTAGGVKG